MAGGPVLRCEGLGAGFGAKVVLAEIDLEVDSLGVTTLMGPGGCGKSTLLRSLAGVITSELHSCWGAAFYAGARVSLENRPPLVAQRIELVQRSAFDNLAFNIRRKANNLSSRELRARIDDWLEQLELTDIANRLDSPFTELDPARQRIVAILREASINPAMLMIDEPTSGLAEQDAARILDLIERLAQHSAIFLVLHNQKQARRISRHIVLLAGGRVQAQGDVNTFFEELDNPVVKQFVTTGSCALPSPDIGRECLAEDIEPPPQLPPAALAVTRTTLSNTPTLSVTQTLGASEPEAKSNFVASQRTNIAGPSGFIWILEGKLAGTPYPGVVHGARYDLELLTMAGVTTLVTLTEREFPRELLERYGLDSLHCAIVDRKAPTIAQTEELIFRMRQLLNDNKVLAVHCWAGLGRTGLILAAYLIREQGLSSREALTRLRRLNPGYVQTPEQELFLCSYEQEARRLATA
jgi:atypical dual specificity phosphatase